MIVRDKLYGTVTVEPVLAAVITSKAVQRLKRIRQSGAIFLVDPSVTHTRYDHSIGAMLLVRRMGGSIEEQLAALLHDCSHTAFSHVADYVFANAAEDYHEQQFERVIAASDIPQILAAHGLNVALLDDLDERYSLLEQPLPELCADRLDYTLRDLLEKNTITPAEVAAFLETLAVHDGKMVLRSAEAAAWITRQYTLLVEEWYAKPEHVYANRQLAEVLKAALERGVIAEADLLTDDVHVLQLLEANAACAEQLAAIRKLEGLDEFLAANADHSFKKRSLRPTVVNG